MGGLSPSTDPGARPARPPAPPPGTGARFGTLRALWRPVAAFHPAQEPGGLLRPALLRPPAPAAWARRRPRPARLSRRHALWRPAAAKSGAGAGRTFPPGSFVSINAPPFIPPPAPLPICPAPRPPARSGRLFRRHALDPGGPFSVLFLERGSKGNGSDRIGPPPTSSREAFTKEKDEKAEQLSRPRAAGRGGLSAGRPGDERAAAR